MEADKALSQFEEKCKRLSTAIPDNYQWQWEERFENVLVVFDKIDMEPIRASLLEHFSQHWDSSNAENATENIGNLIRALYGISPGQILFNSDEQTGLMLYAAWWPWGNGVSISLRIGIYQPDEEKADAGIVEQRLKEWFSL